MLSAQALRQNEAVLAQRVKQYREQLPLLPQEANDNASLATAQVMGPPFRSVVVAALP